MNQPGRPQGNAELRATSRRYSGTFILSLALALVCSAALVQIFIRDRQEHAEHIHSLADKTRLLASQYLATDRNFLQMLAQRAAAGDLASSEYRDRAAQYVTYHPYLINIAWADADFIIRDTAPFEPNRQVIGLKLELPEPERASRQAMTAREPAYTLPFVVIQGEPAFEVYLPVFRGDTFLGTFSGVYSVRNFLAQLETTLSQEHVQFALSSLNPLPAEQEPGGPEITASGRHLALAEIPGLHLELNLRATTQSRKIHALLVIAVLLGGLLLVASLRLNRELQKRRQMEVELRRSERLYHSVYDHAGQGIALTTIDGYVLQSNGSFARMLGRSPGEIKGMNFKDFTHPEDQNPSAEMMVPLQGGEVDAYTLEKRYLNRQGETVWGQLTATCVRRDDGSPDFLIGMVTDVSERHLAEQALIERERQYRTLFQTMAQGVFYQDADGRISSANRAACEMFGLSEDEMLGRTSLDPRWKVIHEDGSDYPGPEHPSMVALTTGKEVRGAVAGVYNPQTGDVRWLNITAIPEFKSAESRPFRVFVTMHDFTEQKLAVEKQVSREASYRLLSEQFQTLLDAIADPMYMLDREHTLLWRNRATEEYFGPRPAVGKTCAELLPGTDGFNDPCIASNCFASGVPEVVHTTSAAGRALTLRAFPVVDDTGETARVLVLINDETEKLQQQQTMLRTGQLAAVGELAAGVAHEINNPINGIINYAQILCNRLPEGSLEQQIARKTRNEGERIATIASSLLSYTRENSSRKRRIALSVIIDEVLLISGTKMRNQGIRVTRDIPGDLPDLFASPQQLQQVFLNLLSNARYALIAPHGRNAAADRSVTISAVVVGESKVLITIRDTGSGIPEQLLAKIQEPFFTTKPGQEGTGLGLSICKDILARHDSSLQIESRAGEFTAVSFQLPCFNAAAAENA